MLKRLNPKAQYLDLLINKILNSNIDILNNTKLKRFILYDLLYWYCIKK